MKELYEFRVGSEIYRYSSSESDVSFGGNTYEAKPIQRNEVVNEFENQGASISMPWDLAPAPKFRILNPSAIVWVTILKENGLKVFVGRVSNCSFKEGLATLKLTSLQGMMKTKIPARTYSRECSFELFCKGCDLNKEDFRTILLPNNTSVDTLTIKSSVLAEKEDGYYAGGYAQISYEHSYILTHVGDTITLLYPLQLWTASASIYVFPGCNKMRATCKNKFKNEKNYGGYAFVPSKNPITQGF